MPRDAHLTITPDLAIPWSELEFRATRSGGPGGQHVNTASTRVELWWSPHRSAGLPASARRQLLARLGPRLTADGWLRIVASSTRSQHRNRELAIERFQTLVARALHVPKLRRPTRPTASSRERRLEEKRRRGALKHGRRRPAGED